MLLSLLIMLFLGIWTPLRSNNSLEKSESVVRLTSILDKIVPLRSLDKKIEIPLHIKHIKLDIGLSYSAPMSQYWLSHEKDLIVFGFEPNPACVESILQGATKRHKDHGDPLQLHYIGKNFFLIPCALGISNSPITKFIITTDCGCSSLYKPKFFEVERVLEVPIFSLKDFFDCFPFDTHPVIDYIKIDAQGADLDIVKSAGAYMQERVIYITLEAEDNYYENTVNSTQDIYKYMQSIGFIPYKSSQVQDPTFFNSRYAAYVHTHRVQIYQKG